MTASPGGIDEQVPAELPVSGSRPVSALDTHMERCASCGQPRGYWATDRLTGLPDRWGWEDVAPAQFAHALRQRQSVALLMVDIDHFKRVNDEFGHVAGDLVLRAVSTRLRAATRATDLVSRYGGDEFLVLLPGATSVGALAVARRVREGMKALTVSAPTAPGGACVAITDQTVSIGVAVTQLSHRGPDLLEDLLLCADAALRAVKRNGRDDIRIANGDHAQTPGTVVRPATVVPPRAARVSGPEPT